MKTLRFAAVGDNCIDRFQPPLSQSLVGGNAVNVAVQLSRLGHVSYYFGAVGPDADGHRTRALLRDNGVNVDHLQERPGVTAYTDIKVLGSGERIFVHEDFGVCAGYRPTPADQDVLMTMDHVHIGWMDDGGALRRALKGAGVSVSQDISVNADAGNLGVDGLAVAFGSVGSDDEAVDRLLLSLLDDGASLAVVTRGPKGAAASDGTLREDVDIRPVAVVDTTGAGDSFIAGFLSGRIGGLPLRQCLLAGREAAAVTCTHVGGFPQAALDE